MADLRTEILGGLVTADPFMIASSHWTSNKNSFKHLNSVHASAVTLKTTSEATGGDGKVGDGISRTKLWLQNPFGSKFALYTDGPKQLEHWNLDTTVQMTQLARQILPDTILGLSVLANADYEASGKNYKLVASRLSLESYGYVELNWKYTFRRKDCTPEQLLEEVLADLAAFFDTFNRLPVLVKLSRESLRHLESKGFHKILKLIDDRGGALIVANTLRAKVPPSRLAHTNQAPLELNKGVVFGEYLFLDTYNILRSLSELRESGVQVPPLIASGGIVDIGSVVDSIAAGARAVQLCSALDLRTHRVVETLREELNDIVAKHGSFKDFATAIRTNQIEHGAAVVRARRFAFEEISIIHNILDDPFKIDGFIIEALREECSIAQPEAKPSDHRSLSTPYKFVITFGNVSGTLLANSCVQRLRLRPLDMENMSAFRENLKVPEFEYDFALIPEASLLSIQAEGSESLGSRYPEKIGKVANSLMELVGDETLTMDKVATIYNFGGSSATEAVNRLRTETNASIEELSIASCYPLFKFWNPENAILAKPPLSRFYGLFAPPELAKRWGAIWRLEEPLWLVASARTVANEEGRRVAKIVQEVLELERVEILKDADRAVRSINQSGFVRYCAKLLGSKETL